MDIVDIGAAVQRAKKTVLPSVSAADAGASLVVSSEGTWEKGEVAAGATISVSGTTLSIVTGG